MNRTRDLALHVFSGERLFCLFGDIPAPWSSGWVVGCMHRDLAVVFLEIWDEPDLHPVLHLSKQQCLTAQFTALRYQSARSVSLTDHCLFGSGLPGCFLRLFLSQGQIFKATASSAFCPQLVAERQRRLTKKNLRTAASSIFSFRSQKRLLECQNEKSNVDRGLL